MAESSQLLNVPQVDSVRYKRNFIKTAVCELRFPTLLELEKKEPSEFQRKLRKDYPFYEKQKAIGVSLIDTDASTVRYLFKSKKKDWMVTLKSSAIALETSHYTEFKDFLPRLRKVVNAAKDIIDADFFTRAGLRYINTIPTDSSDIGGWINPDLITSLLSGEFGTVSQYRSEVHGRMDVGRYSMRYGLQPNEKDPKLPQYFLDFDYFKEDVEAEELLGLIESFSRINFSLFHWCLGPKAIEFLGKPVSKRRG